MKGENLNLLMQTALALSSGDKPNEALDIFNEIIEIEPHYLDAYYERGMVYLKMSQPDKALADFEKILSEDSDYGDAYYQRGMIRFGWNDFYSALDDFNEAIERFPDFTDAYYARALTYVRMNRYYKAIDDYTYLISNNPDSINFYIQRGEVYYVQNVIDKSLEDFNKAISLDPDNAECHTKRAIAMEAGGDIESAVNEFKVAIGLEPDNPSILLGLANTYIRLNDYNLALSQIKKVLEIDPAGSSAWEAVQIMAPFATPRFVIDPLLNIAYKSKFSRLTLKTEDEGLQASYTSFGVDLPLTIFPLEFQPPFIAEMKALCNMDEVETYGSFIYRCFDGKETMINFAYEEIEEEESEKPSETGIKVEPPEPKFDAIKILSGGSGIRQYNFRQDVEKEKEVEIIEVPTLKITIDFENTDNRVVNTKNLMETLLSNLENMTKDENKNL